MKKTVVKQEKSESLYGVFALLLMLLFMFCLASVTIFGIKKFMQPIKKDVVVDGFHWERAIKTDEAIATGDDQNPYWPEISLSKSQSEDCEEYYNIIVQEKNNYGKNIQRRYRMTNLSDWKSLKKGEKITLIIDRFNFAALDLDAYSDGFV